MNWTLNHKLPMKQEIVNRDGPQCWICGLLMDVDFGSPAKTLDIRASIDHLFLPGVPSRNEVSNLKLAHAYCNYIRQHQQFSPEIHKHCQRYLIGHYHRELAALGESPKFLVGILVDADQVAKLLIRDPCVLSTRGESQ